MGKFEAIGSAVLVAALLAVLAACGSSVAPTPGFGVAASVKLAPAPIVSLDLGDTVQFAASAVDGNRSPLSTTFTYRTSNPNVVSISNNGLACAGTWDSVAIPVVCTPGGVGSAQITAYTNGVVSSPTTVYVHQHIAQINVSPITISKPPFPFPPDSSLGFPFPVPKCYTALAGSTTAAQSQSYEAQALADDASGQPTLDITSSVGPFFWSSSQLGVATLTPLTAFGIANGQVQVTAHTPGMTQITASITSNTSAPVSFMTCPVQSITLAVNQIGGTTITGPKGTSSTIGATVLDIAGNQIAPTLTWTSSNPTVAAVTSNGGVASPGAGGATITASCIAPNCNVNLSPPQSIYPGTPIGATYSGTTSTPFSVYVASSNPSCAANAHCTAFLVPMSGSPPAAGNPVPLIGVPNPSPNAIRFAPSGNSAFLGSQKGLMVLAAAANPPTLTSSPTTTGNVLAVSPDGKKVIVADTASPVNQVFVVDAASGTATNFLISGATAAAFSPDSLKAFIVAGSTLYVYSPQSAFQSGPLPAAGTDVAFLPNGMFGYVAEGAAGTSYLATCDDPGVALSTQIGSVSGAMSFIRALPDGSGFVGLVPPNLNVIKASISGMPLAIAVSGCPGPLGALSVSNTVSSVDLGAGTFIPLAFLLSSDGQKGYIVVQNSATIIVYDFASQLTSSLALAGNPNPLSAALSPDGQTLYVGADDGKVHFVNTVSGGDVDQVEVPSSNLCTISSGGTQPTCLPNVLAVKP